MPFSLNIRPFNGDFNSLASLMQDSWSENREQPLLYSPDFLRSSFQQPGTSLDLAPALYQDEELLAFGAAFPRTVSCTGTPLKLALDSFITVAKSQKGKGIGGRIWSQIARRAQQQGFDGLITFCVEGDRMNDVLLRYSEQYGFRTQHAYTVQYLARTLPASTAPQPQTADPEIFLQCAAFAAQQTAFSRTFTAPEAHWQCRQRSGAFGASLEADGSCGVITAYAMPTAGATHTICGIIEDVLWHQLGASARCRLLDQLLAAAAAHNIELLLCPVMGYTDLHPLRTAGFRRTKRVLHMYLTSWSDALSLQPLSSAYIDVF